MDISTDILHLSTTAFLVPGLSITFKLAMQIIKTIQVCHLVAFVSLTKFICISQISERNTARLQYLAHLVADSLVSIAQHMQRRWDVIPSAPKTMLDEFEGYVVGFSGLTLKILCVPFEWQNFRRHFQDCETAHVFINHDCFLQRRRWWFWYHNAGEAIVRQAEVNSSK